MLLHSLVALLKRVLSRVRPSRRHARRRMQNFELLEGRGLLSAVSITGAVYAQFEVEGNNTLDTAQDIGQLQAQDIAAINGLIGEGTGLSTDADWYSFEVSEPTNVQVNWESLLAGNASNVSTNPSSSNNRVESGTNSGAVGNELQPIISLYSGASELWESHNPLRHQLLHQSSAEDGDVFNVTLGAGTYFVAVTGAGNRFFHPFLSDSGLPGSATAYSVRIEASPLNLTGTVGAQVLGTSIDSNLELSSAPNSIRIRFDRALDESLIADGDTVQLFATQSTTISDADEAGSIEAGSSPDEQLLSVGYWSFSHQLNELTLMPTSALKAGAYRIVLSNRLLAPGDESSATDFELRFNVLGNEGLVPSEYGDDTVETATDLGSDLARTTLQISGAIGDDSAYDFNSADINLLNPASDVDLYRFEVTGGGQWSFIAEAFAGRFGSALDPSLTLFRRLDDGTLEQVHFNGNTQNPAEASNGTLPLFTDSVLYAGLTAGEYFLAISSATNDPEYGPDGVFNPLVTHSGLNGGYTGNYVLNLSLVADNVSPRVTATSIRQGETLTELPRAFTVSFSEMVNLQQTAAEAYLRPSDDVERDVFITSADGARIYPRFESYDVATQTATFLMLDGLPNGAHELHLPAGAALTDLAGNAVISNDPSGDYIIRFNVDAPARGVDGNTQVRAVEVGHQRFEEAQELGVLFPRELEAVVTVNRTSSSTNNAADTDNYIRFEVLQTQFYFIALRVDEPSSDNSLMSLELLDNAGQRTDFVADGELAGQGVLHAGQYVLHVGSWTADQAAVVSYRVELALAGNSENPTPLTSGAASAIGLRLNQASQLGSTSLPTTFVRPIVSLPTTTGTNAASNSSASSNPVVSTTPVSPNVTPAAIAAIPRSLNQSLVARPLGAEPLQDSDQRTGSSDTLLVKLWDKPEVTKLFALLDDELATVNRTRRDASNNSDTETENADVDRESVSPAATSEAAETEAVDDGDGKHARDTDRIKNRNNINGVLQDRHEAEPSLLDRILKRVNDRLKTPRDAASVENTTSAENQRLDLIAEPQTRLDSGTADQHEFLRGSLSAPLGMVLALGTITATGGTRRAPQNRNAQRKS